jgi:hypothetical protein
MKINYVNSKMKFNLKIPSYIENAQDVPSGLKKKLDVTICNVRVVYIFVIIVEEC